MVVCILTARLISLHPLFAGMQRRRVGDSTLLKVGDSTLLRPLDLSGPFHQAATALVVTAGSVSRSEDLPNLA